MTPEEKRNAIAHKQEWINSLPFTPLMPYPFCCICYVRLTEHNILEEDDHLIDVCLDCKDK